MTEEGYSGHGRPYKSGEKFKLADSETWTEPESCLELTDTVCGRVRVKMWTRLYLYGAAQNQVNLILVERIDPTKSGKILPPLWLVWTGERTMPLEEIWDRYLRRFGIEHWYRFAKQRLHWTMPSLKTPEQCERWSDLMPIMTWQLWLARDLVTQYHFTVANCYSKAIAWTFCPVHVGTFN